MLQADNKHPQEGIHNKCGFSTTLAVHSNMSSFTPAQQQTIQKVTVRPELQASLVSPRGWFRIHYNTKGDSVPSYDPQLSAIENARQAALAFDSAYAFEVNYLKFLPPPADNNAGGDDLYDIYIINTSFYGNTEYDQPAGPNQYTSYIEIDNDFAPGERFFTHGFNAMKVTAAHEFNHAIQLGSYNSDGAADQRFFYEMTSTSMEEFVFNDVNDYYGYLSTYFSNPDRSFSFHDGYDLAIWNIFLKDLYGYDIIRKQWEYFMTNPALKSINLSLADYQSSFKNALSTFAIWTYYTGFRKIPGRYFEEAANYPVITPAFRFYLTGTQLSNDISIHPMSNNFLKYIINKDKSADTVNAILTNSDINAGLVNPAGFSTVNYSFYNYAAAGADKIANNYYKKFTTDFPDLYVDQEIFNDSLANGGDYIIAEVDYAFPSPFRYSESSFVYIPTSLNKQNKAELSVFTPSMKRVYNAERQIVTMNNKIVIRWDGRDADGNKLPTGVYIYVTNSDDTVSKGKIVIYNE